MIEIDRKTGKLIKCTMTEQQKKLAWSMALQAQARIIAERKAKGDK